MKGITCKRRLVVCLVGILVLGPSLLFLQNTLAARAKSSVTTLGQKDKNQELSPPDRGTKEGEHHVCDEPPVLNLGWLKSLDSTRGGHHICEGFEHVCMDQGVLVLHDTKYSPANPQAADLPRFDITDLLVKSTIIRWLRVVNDKLVKKLNYCGIFVERL
jgi:hypothetical protein